MRSRSAHGAANVLGDSGFDVSSAIVDVSLRESVRALVEAASSIGDITGLIHAAEVFPSQASQAMIL